MAPKLSAQQIDSKLADIRDYVRADLRNLVARGAATMKAVFGAQLTNFCKGMRSVFPRLSGHMRMRRSHCWHNIAKAAVFTHVQKLVAVPRPVMTLSVIAVEVFGGVQLLAP